MTRRALLASAAVPFMFACGGCVGGGAAAPGSGSGPSRARAFDAGSLPGTTVVDGIPVGDVRELALLAESGGVDEPTPDGDFVRTDGFAETSNLVLADDALYLGVCGELRCYDALTGSLIARDRDAASGSAVSSVARSGDLIISATSAGALRAHVLAQPAVEGDAPSLDSVWSRACANGDAVVGAVRSYGDDGAPSTEILTSDATWRTTDIVCAGNSVLVGFSSYQVDPGSILSCVDLVDGSLRWTRGYEGRFTYDGGVSQPYAVEAGLLVPVPEQPALELVDIETGKVADELSLDAPIGMGFTPVPGAADEVVTQTRAGTLLHMRVSGNVLELIASISLRQVGDGVEDAGEEGSGAFELPSIMQPVVVGGKAVCNAPASEGKVASVVSVDLDTGDVQPVYQGFFFDTTPCVLLSADEGAAALVSLTQHGLGAAEIDAADASLAAWDLLSDEVTCPGTTREARMAVRDDGTVLVVSGNTNRQRLYSIS